MSELRELQLFRSAKEAEEVVELLRSEGLEVRVSSTSRAFDVSQIGGLGGDESDAEILVVVEESDFDSARELMERSYLSTPIPAGHFLEKVTDEDLVEIVGEQEDWSPFDVVHAKRLIKERGLDLELIEEKRVQRINRLKNGKRASKMLLCLGWLAAISGGLAGILIAWSLVSMKEKTSAGEFYAFDEYSRNVGAKMMRVSIVVFAVLAVLWLANR